MYKSGEMLIRQAYHQVCWRPRLNRLGALPFVQGFTLIEILVVMVIIGLMAGVALPRLSALSQRYEIAAQRQNLLTEIANLGYRAYINGQESKLTSMAAPTPHGSSLDLPPGWKIEAHPPIIYSFNGICAGGRLALVNPDGWREEFQLAAPLCQPTPQNAAQ